ncbi:Hypothetical protein NTJ_12545, partial [Nesidiocoris tenuis]
PFPLSITVLHPSSTLQLHPPPFVIVLHPQSLSSTLHHRPPLFTNIPPAEFH